MRYQSTEIEFDNLYHFVTLDVEYDVKPCIGMEDLDVTSIILVKIKTFDSEGKEVMTPEGHKNLIKDMACEYDEDLIYRECWRDYRREQK